MSKIIQFPEQLDSFEYKRVKISELILSHEVDQATQLYRKWFMAKETGSGQQALLSFTVWKSGQELEREEEYELAAKCHRAVVDMDPTHQSAYKRLFLCLERSGQYEAAIRVCDEAIGMEEGNIFRDEWTKGGWYGRRSRATKKLEGGNEMSNQTGENESRTLSSGEIVYLVKEPGRKWKIKSYECPQNVRFGGPLGGLVFEYLQGLPRDWKDREFGTSDEAAKFAQREIQNDKVPGNTLVGPGINH